MAKIYQRVNQSDHYDRTVTVGSSDTYYFAELFGTVQSDIFWANSSTTLAQITAAHSSGKEVCYNVTNDTTTTIYRLSELTATGATFMSAKTVAGTNSDNYKVYILKLNNGTWGQPTDITVASATENMFQVASSSVGLDSRKLWVDTSSGYAILKYYDSNSSTWKPTNGMWA